MPSLVAEPLDVYRTRLKQAEDARTSLDASFRALAYARLGAGIAIAAVAAFAIGVQWIAPAWLVVPIAIFVFLAIRHGAVDREREIARRSAAFYERGIARIEDRWIGGGTQISYAPDGHLYAADLDLFGKGSLFELLSVCRTATGERTLAGWLLAPADLEIAKARQEAVKEMAPLLALREDIALAGTDIRAAADDRSLAEWGNRPASRFFPGAKWIALLLAIAAAATFAGYMLQQLRLSWFLIVILAEMVLAYFIRQGIQNVVTSAGTPSRELRLLALLLQRIEREPFQGAALKTLKQQLRVGGKDSTAQILRLERLVDRMEWARNMFFTPIAAPLLWVPQCAMAIERWRAECGPHIAEWVAAIGDFEALSSLASFCYERPSAVFPELIKGEPELDAEGLAHPLIHPSRAVPNDVRLASNARLWIVSGSNMSGKSTLLRAVGITVALAWAGGAVTAKRARLSGLEVGASLTTHDSLADNKSRFYAEITRLRDIVNLAKEGRPVLFLLDELLSGTNSHDRRIGAQGLVEGLLAQGAIGMVTTHDLALAEIGGQFEGARNVHFEDEMRGKEIHFDYRVRPGVIKRGNALELMRAVGLDV